MCLGILWSEHKCDSSSQQRMCLGILWSEHKRDSSSTHGCGRFGLRRCHSQALVQTPAKPSKCRESQAGAVEAAEQEHATAALQSLDLETPAKERCPGLTSEELDIVKASPHPIKHYMQNCPPELTEASAAQETLQLRLDQDDISEKEAQEQTHLLLQLIETSGHSPVQDGAKMVCATGFPTRCQ